MTAPAERPHPALLWGLALAMSLFWGLNPLVGKVALASFPPTLLVAVRTALAAVTIWLVFVWVPRGEARIERRDWPILLALGLGAQVGNQVLFVVGLERTSVTHAAFLFSLSPILVLSLAALIGQERITVRKLFGMVTAAFGVMLLTRDRAGGAASLEGDLILLGAVLLFACYSVFGKEKRKAYGPIVMNTVAYSAGALALQPLIWWLHRDFVWSSASAGGWAALAYMATFPAVLGYLIYIWALGHLPASRLAALQYLQPPLAAALSVVFLGETITATLAVAGAVILTGVYLVERG